MFWKFRRWHSDQVKFISCNSFYFLLIYFHSFRICTSDKDNQAPTATLNPTMGQTVKNADLFHLQLIRSTRLSTSFHGQMMWRNFAMKQLTTMKHQIDTICGVVIEVFGKLLERVMTIIRRLADHSMTCPIWLLRLSKILRSRCCIFCLTRGELP